MRQSLNDIILQLYEATLTPQVKDEYASSEVLNIVDYILKSNSRQLHYREVTDREIQEIVYFILKLVNTPQNLQGCIIIEPCITYLVEEACKDINVPYEIQKKIVYIISDWFAALKATPKANKLYSKRPDIGDYPLFRFHIDSYRDSNINNKCYLYKAYAYQLHKAIRTNEEYRRKTGFSDETHEAYVRSARFFFKYMPLDIKAKTSHPNDIPQEYIEKFVRQYDKTENRNEDPLTDAAKSYKQKFIRLLDHKQIVPKPHEGHSHSGGGVKRKSYRDDETLKPKLADGEINILRADGYLPRIEEYMERLDESDGGLSEDREENYCKEFEAPVEINIYNFSDEEKEPIVAKKPSISKRYEDIINLRNFHFYWDSNYLNLFHYSVMYKVFQDNWRKSSYYDSIIAYLYILIHTGIDCRKLLDLKIVHSEEETNESIGLLIRENTYYILNQSPIQLKKPDSNANCLNTTSLVRIPFPETAGKLISKTLGHNSLYVFSYADTSGRVKRLSILDIENFIEKEIKGIYPHYNLKITPPKISRSFMPLYHHRFGLDPIICCYISGQDHQRLYKSQMHYIHLEHSILEREYLKTYELVEAAINRNLYECILRGFLNGNAKSALSTLFETKKTESEGSISYSVQEPIGYGSSIICDEEYIKNIVEVLKKALLNEKDMVNRHNLYTIYTYLCLQFNTGLRPRNDPDITWNDYIEDAGTIAIQDKQSAKYHEKRFLPLSGVANSLLKNLKNGFKDLQRYIAIHKTPSIMHLQTKIFFLINTETGKFENFTLKRIMETLQSIGINYTLPMNMPRHYMRNFLYHAGISNDLADIWMGHQHAGKEVLNITSSAAYGKAFTESLPVIESMLDRLGFRDIAYMNR